MQNHVYVWISGYGLTVVPFAPYEIKFGTDGPATLDIRHFTSKGNLFARLIADQMGGYRSKIDQHTKSLFDVTDIAEGAKAPYWQIETSWFCCNWPEGYSLFSTEYPDDSVLFEMTNNHNDLIFIQNGMNAPQLSDMYSPEQRVININESTNTIEIEYDNQDNTFYQRHQKIIKNNINIVLSAQSLYERSRTVTSVAASIAESIQPIS